MNASLLEIANLRVRFARPRAEPVLAVDDVSFELARGEALALVGESGSGKSTLARAIVRLVAASSGSIVVRPARATESIDVVRARGPALRELRRAVQIVFQDPLGSLNPRLSLRDTLAEALSVHGERDDLYELLDAVGLARSLASSRPHELSGGQAQRAAIARALAVEPELLICDEVLAALDLSVQAQVLELLARLRRERGLALLFIAHDLAAARWLADRIVVMQRGRVVESGAIDEVYERPRHEYTRALVAASAPRASVDQRGGRSSE